MIAGGSKQTKINCVFFLFCLEHKMDIITQSVEYMDIWDVVFLPITAILDAILNLSSFYSMMPEWLHAAFELACSAEPEKR